MPGENPFRTARTRVIAVASGKETKSEAVGVGSEEFNPWILGATL